MFLTQARTPRDTTKFPTAQLFVLGMFLIGSNPLPPFCRRAQVIAGLDLKPTLSPASSPRQLYLSKKLACSRTAIPEYLLTFAYRQL